MEKHHVLDKRQVKLEEIMKEGYIPMFGGRPDRKTIISEEDILNLRINLNITGSVETFMKTI
jgi:hypothetical protein